MIVPEAGIIVEHNRIVRKKAVYVIDFRDKLDHFIRVQSIPVFDKNIAEFVGVSPESLCQYVMGTQSREAGRLPSHRVGRFLKLFQIQDSDIFTDYRIKEFKAEVIVPQYTKDKNGVLIRQE